MKYNLVLLSKKEKEKINVDLAAASVAFKERYNIPIVVKIIENQQPVYLREWFKQRLMHHRHARTSIAPMTIKTKR